MREEIKPLVAFLYKLKEDIESLNNAWSAANKPVIFIDEIKEKVQKAHRRVRYPGILFSLFSVVGNSKQIDVSAWMQ